MSPLAWISAETGAPTPPVNRKKSTFEDLSVGTSDLGNYDPYEQMVGRLGGRWLEKACFLNARQKLS